MAGRRVIAGQRAMALDVVRIVRRRRPFPGTYEVDHVPSGKSFVVQRLAAGEWWQIRRSSGAVVGHAETQLDSACIIDRVASTSSSRAKRTPSSIIGHHRLGRGRHELVHRLSGRRFVVVWDNDRWEAFAPPRGQPQAAFPTLLDAACWIDRHLPERSQNELPLRD